MKGLSPAGLQSQAGTKRFEATGTQFERVVGFNCEKAALGDRKSQAQISPDRTVEGICRCLPALHRGRRIRGNFLAVAPTIVPTPAQCSIPWKATRWSTSVETPSIPSRAVGYA